MDGIPPAYRPRLCGTQEISHNLSDPLTPIFSLQFIVYSLQMMTL